MLVSDNQPQLSRVSDSVLPLADCMKLYYFFHLGDFLSLVITHITPADLGLPQMSKLREGLKKHIEFFIFGSEPPIHPLIWKKMRRHVVVGVLSSLGTKKIEVSGSGGW